MAAGLANPSMLNSIPSGQVLETQLLIPHVYSELEASHAALFRTYPVVQPTLLATTVFSSISQ